jgi:predicted DNA-binding transcriptional regulator AlpA
MTSHQKLSPPAAADPMMTASASANMFGIGLPAFWRGVRERRFPAPVYVTSRSPRWFQSELLAAVRRQRMLPMEAVARRSNKLPRIVP